MKKILSVTPANFNRSKRSFQTLSVENMLMIKGGTDPDSGGIIKQGDLTLINKNTIQIYKV